MVSQIEDLKSKQIRYVDKINTLNKDVTDLYLIIQKLSKNCQNHHKKSSQNVNKNNKDKETKANNENKPVSKNKICKFYNRGYCKFKMLCSFIHPKTKCTMENCKDKLCEKRHIKQCKNYTKGFCKFTECEFMHDPQKVNSRVNNTTNANPENHLGDETDHEQEEVDNIIKELENFNNESNDSKLSKSNGNDSDSQIQEIMKECGESMDLNNVNDFENEKTIKPIAKNMSNNFSCDKCHFTFQNKRSFNKHVKTCHKQVEILNTEEQHKNDMINEVNMKKRKSENDNIPIGKKSK